MGFDRTRIKQEAKTRMRQASPKAWKVTLVYLGLFFLIELLLLSVAVIISMRSSASPAHSGSPPP